ncbi:hypothetical protein AVEN_33504-1 [Araneus ventricosus]|uniref:Uncharacterized protein n=1 Tax=Araneus ventricosus TaxID=182803 RepID=A0A4Y2L4T4_ARAVE|nr:hypothetical protein AVEN_33504-1 [Araneus ventricosus]
MVPVEGCIRCSRNTQSEKKAINCSFQAIVVIASHWIQIFIQRQRWRIPRRKFSVNLRSVSTEMEANALQINPSSSSKVIALNYSTFTRISMDRPPYSCDCSLWGILKVTVFRNNLQPWTNSRS